jgi:DNA invertase Pin-like site-specific DNA recombinase
MQTQTRQILRPVELIPAIGYIRVSTWFEEKISDELQKAAIEDAARRRGRTIVKWIPDLDATGRNFKRRIMEAISAVETGSFEGANEIWVWKYSRFGRNRHGVAINLARVEQAGGHLISATEEIDATTATGRFTRGMLFELAAFESDRIGEQWRETHEYRRAHGLPATGGARFGYVWHQREIEEGVLKIAEHYEPDPETAPTVRQLYEDYALNDATLREMAQMLNKSHVFNPAALKNDGWSRQALVFCLDSGFAAGLLHVHRNDATCAIRSKCHNRAHYGFIPGAQPPLITDDLWAAYLEKRERRRELPPRLRRPTYPYSGLTRCGLCGGNACSANDRRGNRGAVYRCQSRYNQQERTTCRGSAVSTRAIEAEMQRWLQETVGEIDRRVRGSVVLPKQVEPRHDDERKRRRIAGDLEKVQKGLDKASMAHAMGDMPLDSYRRVRDQLVARRSKLEEELDALKAAEVDESETTWEFRGAVVRRLVEEWETLSVSGKRELLSKALREIRIFPAGMEPRVVLVPRDGFVF